MKRIGAVILAAGGSSRLGRPKQLLELHGEPLLRRVARCAIATGASPVVVVLGAGIDLCRGALVGLDVRLLENPRWTEGMGTSVATGVAALADVDVDAALLLTCDQPGIWADALGRLIAAFDGSGIVAARYAGTLGIPAIFPASEFPALRALSGDTGARRLLRANADAVIAIDLPEAEGDIDSAADWESLAGKLPD